MAREKSPPPPAVRPPPAPRVETARSKADTISQPMAPPSAIAPPAKMPAAFTPKEALARSAVLVDQIPAVVEQMRYHKKQARRLAELASWVFDAIDTAVPKPASDDPNAPNSEGLEKLIRILYRIEERLRDVGAGNLVTRMNELTFVQHDLSELEDDCVEVADMFGIEAPLNYERTLKARHEDELALKDLAAKLEKDPDALADKIGLRGSKLDEESQKSLQIMLYSIEHSPDKVLPEFRSFAESAARTIFSRTKQEIPRDLPWHVRPREFKQGKKIGDGGFSTVFKGYWVSRQIEVAIKVFEEQGENVDKLIKEIVIWKEHEHPCLLKFFAGCLFDKPKFLVSPYCKNGNALDYLKLHPEANREKMLLDVSRGMHYLHTAKIVHGDLKARNVLIGDDVRALVADFGLAEFERHDVVPTRAGTTSSGTGEKTPRLIGTPHWLAPECFKEGVVDRKYADIWAFGMTAYELYEDGKVPLAHVALTDLSDKLEAGERPSKPVAHPPPEHIWKMMELCWSYDTIERPAFSEVTMALGFFEKMDVDTIKEIDDEITGGSITPNLSKWPGLLKQLVNILATTLHLGSLGPTRAPPSTDLKPIPELTASEEKLVVLTLTMIRNTTNYFLYDNLQMQNIYDSGAIAALHHILRRKDDISNPEILSITVGIVANVMQSLDTTGKKTSLSQNDFMDALMQLINNTGDKQSTHAMTTMRSFINSFGWGSTGDEHLNLRKRVVVNGIVPKLAGICREAKDNDAICETMDFIALLGMNPTVLDEAQIKALCPAVVEVASNELDGRARSYSMYTLAKLSSESDAQAEIVRSCQILPKVLTLIKGKGSELFDGSYYTAGETLQHLALEEDIPAILELLQITEDRPVDDPLPYAIMNDPVYSAKLAACQTLARLGNKLKTPEDRVALANKYPVFTSLQPLLSSSNEQLVDACRTALALYSASQDFPFVLQLLSDKSSGARAVATKICVSLVEAATEDKKIAATQSGILPELKNILDDPPPRPPPIPPYVFNPDPESIPLPTSPSPSHDSFVSDVETSGIAVSDAPLVPVVKDLHDSKEHTTSSETALSGESDAATVTVGHPSGSDDGGSPMPSLDQKVEALQPLLPEPSQVLAQEAEVQSQPSAASPLEVADIALDESLPPPRLPSALKPLIVHDTKDSSEGAVEPIQGQKFNGPGLARVTLDEALKSPRSPRAKAVTFDSTDRVVIMEAKATYEAEDGSNDDPESLIGSPQPIHEASLHDPRAKEVAEKERADALARQETKNKEDMYTQAYSALNSIISDISKDALDTVGEAYVAAGLHESYVQALDKPEVDSFSTLGKTQLDALWGIYRLSLSTDEVRMKLINTGGLLDKVRQILDEDAWHFEAKQYACNVLHGLLSGEGDEDEVLDAVEEKDFVPSLAKYMQHPIAEGKWGAQVLSQLIWIFTEETPEETVKTAIDKLLHFCTLPAKPENIEDTFENRNYIIVDYLQRPVPAIQKLGLSLGLTFAKRGLDHRRTLANLAGLRDAVEECAKSDDEEIQALAKDLHEKIKGRRTGAAGARSMRSRPSNM